ncbi:MAG: pyridoxal phosphate-dependent aminotransferase [Bryobacteraceae bacterium]|nr:pyridoxal phosphate-dependent aminotransferase [Bryobacteraceae bacterium]MCX7603188.1 pyridoxal phosphate-dependent aminotransferase [Bryobacteraceae bacterium]
MQLNPAMRRIGTETAFEVLVRARQLEAQGKSVIHLEIGEPDFDTPRHIIDAAKQALDQGWTHYGPTQGLPELREAIAASVSRSHGVNVGADRVCVVPGGKPIIFFSMLALLEPGDEVIYPNPSFPIYESMIRYCGATPVPIPLVESRGFAFDLDLFRDRLSPKTKMVVLNSPANPTGGVLSREDLTNIAEMVRDRDLVVLSDEIYSRIWYDQPPFSIASLPGMLDKTIILDGFSKTYAMTGWRIGYGVMPPGLVDAVNKLMVNSNSCTASFTQRAALAAITGDQAPVNQMVAEFRRRRDAFVEKLNEIPGFRCSMPSGAFYAFPNIEQTGWKSKPLADALLEEAGVACLSGTAFGSFGEGYLRFSYANSFDNLMEAVRRIRSFLIQMGERKRIYANF